MPIAGARPDLSGGPYRSASFTPSRFEAFTEVQNGLQERCIHVRMGSDGRVSTDIDKGGC